MEQHSLEALKELHASARDAKVKKLFSHHQDETKEQIAKLEKVFEIFEFDVTTAPSQATTGIKNQASSLLEKSDTSLHDQITLVSALGNEHFEIASYQGRIASARTLQAIDAVQLLQENLDQETHTSEELLSTLNDLLGVS